MIIFIMKFKPKKIITEVSIVIYQKFMTED